LESVENDHDATTAAALGAVERRGEMLVRMLDPRQFSRPVQDAVRKFLSMQVIISLINHSLFNTFPPTKHFLDLKQGPKCGDKKEGKEIR
jgi:hypothetical protein